MPAKAVNSMPWPTVCRKSESPGIYTARPLRSAAIFLPVLNNLFFGRLKTANPQVQDTINEQIVQLLIEEDLLETILQIGMQFQVGTKGDRLSGGQRRKLAIARVFLKKPKILIMDEATSALDNRSLALIQKMLETHWKGKATVIAVVHRLDIIRNYDKNRRDEDRQDRRNGNL